MLRSSEKTDPHQNLLNRGFVWLFQTCLYAYLNEGEKVRKCYSYLKVMIQAHLHVGFSIIFFIKRWTFNELKWFYLYMKSLQSTQFLNKKIIMMCLAIKISTCNIYSSHSSSQFEKYKSNSTHSYNRKIFAFSGFAKFRTLVLIIDFVSNTNQNIKGINNGKQKV